MTRDPAPRRAAAAPEEDATSLSVITVLHNSARDVEALLSSLARHAPGAQVVAVDSGSTDDGAELARAAGAEVVALDGNHGFGAANNAGLERAAHDVVALLNPDVVLHDDALLRLAAAARRRDALHVPRLTGEAGSVQDSAHPLPGTWRELARAVAPGPLRREPWRTARTAREVGWAIAAVLVARTATLRRLGPFDPSAFLFYEDLELCLHAREYGVPTILHPDAVVEHRGAHSTRPAYGGEPIDVLVRRRRAVIARRLGAGALLRDDVAQLAEHGIRAFRRRDRAHVRAIARARRASG